MAKEPFFERLKREKREELNYEKSLVSPIDYIDWLESFTSRMGSFSTATFLNDPELLSEYDQLNVNHLEELFENISEYSRENYIFPKKTKYGLYYSIKHNDVGYFIGIDYGQGCNFYCERLDEPLEDSLDYEHVVSSVKLPSTIVWDDKLDPLISIIKQLYDDGIPLNVMEDATQKTLRKLKKRKN